MTREEAKDFLPIIKAYAEGKEIEYSGCFTDGNWQKLSEVYFDGSPCDYRVKPEYRPFNNISECWFEMMKHEPFGWLINLETEIRVHPMLYAKNQVMFFDKDTSDFDSMFKEYTFADGKPFGIKED